MADQTTALAMKKRRPNRRPKQNLPLLPGLGGGSVDRACGQLWLQNGNGNGNGNGSAVLKANVAFNSLPTMYINGGYEIAKSPSGEFSRSCPFPAPLQSSSLLGSPVDRTGLPSTAKRRYFAPHWSEQTVEEAIEKGNVFKATFRVNAYNRLEAYCSIDGVPTDILINGVTAQNRAINGDVVAIMLEPVAYWTKLKGPNVPINPVPSDDSNMVPEGREVAGKNCACRGQTDADDLLPVGVECHENGTLSCGEFAQVCQENGFGTSYNRSDKMKCTTPESSSADCASEKGETARALGSIRTLLNSHPSKRPTGRVVAVIRHSPRRRAVIGFLSIKEILLEIEGHRMQTNGQVLKKDKINALLSEKDYVYLMPKDPKFPKMIVNVNSLPDCVKDRMANGDMVVERELIAAQVYEWSEDSLYPETRVINILGKGGEIEPQIAAVLFENAICAAKFSPDSLSCLPDLPWELPVNELENRKDFRSICTFTIDPSSAIDLDDALSVEMVYDDVFRIGVHIADVSYFVHPESALDAEAQIRSTSVYILQHKLPMLPSELSEGACSLLPGLDRLAFSIVWDISRSGNIINRWIGRSVIRSCCKLSYDHVQDVIEGLLESGQISLSKSSSSPEMHGPFEWKDVDKSLRNLYEISMKLRENRFKDGALWLESSKLGILFDEFGTPYDSFLHERKEPCFLVEEFMLLANRSAAEVISMAFPDCALLRRHPEPNLRKLKEFETFCSKHSFELDTSSSGQFHLSLSRIREKLKNDPVLFDILISYASKSMQLATYFCTGDMKGKENDWSHYGLSVPLYTHFTSPLRRYPDIIVHRTLSAALDAEEMLLKRRLNQLSGKEAEASGDEIATRCFTGLVSNRSIVESEEGKEVLSAAALKFKVPSSEALSEVAAYCNERKLASKHAEEAGEKIYLWALLKKKEIIRSKARVLGLGPRFMSLYIQKLAVERRIYYDDVEGLTAEWLETTCTLVLDLSRNKRFQRRASTGKLRAIDAAALVVNSFEENVATEQEANVDNLTPSDFSEEKEAGPAAFPLILQPLSVVPVALHAVGGDDGPVDVGVRLYMCSYFGEKSWEAIKL